MDYITIIINGDIMMIRSSINNINRLDSYKINTLNLPLLQILYDNLTIRSSSGVNPKKPVIYLYPTQKQNTSVKLDFKGILTCTYPAYNNGWDVVAYPNGKLINKVDNREYNYLFWEGLPFTSNWDLTSGYVVQGKNTLDFLQEKLAELGLTPTEYNDFIVYWLPLMEHNKYNLITFQNEAYEDMAKLNINPKPDSILRVFMVYKALDKPMNITKPVIKPFQRKGFTVVEWGGSEIE